MPNSNGAELIGNNLPVNLYSMISLLRPLIDNK
jgi:hypothetical protein